MPRISLRACVSALPLVIKEREQQLAYRIYVSDALRMIGENTAKYAGGQYLQKRYADLINPPPDETRTAEEIIEHMKMKLASV